MAISYPVAFPTINGQSIISKMSMRLVHSVAVQESPFTYSQQIQDFGGSRWEAEITIRPLTHTEAVTFQGFLASLKGRKNTFTVGNPLSTSTKTDSNVQLGANESINSTSIVVDIDSGKSIEAGEMFSINNRLHMFLESAIAGTTTVEITPPLRTSGTSGTDLVTNQPVGLWRLAGNEIEWDINNSSIYSFTFACVEAI
jgi:hypothetical protein